MSETDSVKAAASTAKGFLHKSSMKCKYRFIQQRQVSFAITTKNQLFNSVQQVTFQLCTIFPLRKYFLV